MFYKTTFLRNDQSIAMIAVSIMSMVDKKNPIEVAKHRLVVNLFCNDWQTYVMR